MNQDKYVFAQLTAFMNRTQFNNYVRKYDGNRYVKHFTCWNQLLAMMFGQLSNRESLRDLIVAFEAHRAKQYHLGVGREPIAKTTLASANQNRDCRIFEDFAFYMMKEACEKRATNILDIPGKKYAFDSTTISLCLSTFPWAKFRRKKGGVKAHVLYDIEAQVPAFYTVSTASKHDSTAMSSILYEPNAYYIFDRAYDSFKELYRIHLTSSFYVVRAKTNLKYKTVKWKRRMPKNVLTDAEVKLTGYMSEKKYPESFRLVRFYDEEEEREFTFLTNAKQLTALEVAHVLYDIEAQVPAFYTVSTASKHDSTAMSSILYEPNAYYIFDRAYDSFKELYRIHLTSSFYVVRAKTNLKYKTVKWKRRMPKNVLTDAEVKLTGYMSEKKYPESFRLVRFYDEEEEREFTFLTNAKQLTALEVAELYKKRWLVELFFKWLKQHLKIKKFWDTSVNAVRIQIAVAIKTYCLVAIVHYDMKLKRSTYEVLQILSISLTDKTHLRDLFDKTKFNDVKELDYPLFPGFKY